MTRTGSVSAIVWFCCLTGVALPATASEQRFYTVRVSSRTDLQWLDFFDIPIRSHGPDGVIVRIDENRGADLARAGIQLIQLDRDPALPSEHAMRSETWHKNNDVQTWLDDIEDTYPTIAQRFTLGTSVQGRPIHGIILGTDLDDPTDAVEVRILGGHHGNELMGIELPLLLASHLAQGYDTDPRIKAILDRTRVFIVPLVNPDGREQGQRENANWVDINRVYGYQYHHGTSSGDTDDMPGAGPYSQPEVRAVADHHLAHRFSASLTFHTTGKEATWLWNYSPFGAPDQDIIVELAQRYAAHTCIDQDCYTAEQGSDMYQTYGDTNDFSYGISGDLDYTIETANQDIAHEWEHNRPAILDFLEQAARGVRGKVTDATTGEPVSAMVRCGDAWPSFTDSSDGRYHRILPADTWTCTFWAPGYVLNTLSGIVVGTGNAVVQDVTLTRDEEGPSFGFQAPVVTTYCAYWSNPACEDETYSLAALGPSDGNAFSLTAHGLIVVDMKVARQDEPGADLRVYEGSPYDGESYEVAVSDDFSGPWTVLGTASHTADFDLGPVGGAPMRFVRIHDLGDSKTTQRPGMDLDAIAWLPPGDDGDGSDGADGTFEVEPDAFIAMDNSTLDTHAAETIQDSDSMTETAEDSLTEAAEDSMMETVDSSGTDEIDSSDAVEITAADFAAAEEIALIPDLGDKDIHNDLTITQGDTDTADPVLHGGYARGGCNSTGWDVPTSPFFMIVAWFILAITRRLRFADRR